MLPQEVKMHERRPSLDYHGKRMHSEYNVVDDEECFLFVIDPVINIQGAVPPYFQYQNEKQVAANQD